MATVLHDRIPQEQRLRATARLPSVAPVEGPWLFCDEAYSAQMVERRRLISNSKSEVYAQLPHGRAAACAFLEEALAVLPPGFERKGQSVRCPDGAEVPLDWNAPLLCLGAMLQQDVCILEKQGAEHVLTGAILCFPASWTLAQKIGKPLIGIHQPVDEYTEDIARRVQRLFDGVQPGRPVWRANLLRYESPALFQPRLENDPRPVGGPDARYLRSERQVILRLPGDAGREGPVGFVIHTSVVDAFGS